MWARFLATLTRLSRSPVTRVTQAPEHPPARAVVFLAPCLALRSRALRTQEAPTWAQVVLAMRAMPAPLGPRRMRRISLARVWRWPARRTRMVPVWYQVVLVMQAMRAPLGPRRTLRFTLARVQPCRARRTPLVLTLSPVVLATQAIRAPSQPR